MILERKAPAKINLGLHVLRKRSDGYHDIETVLVRIGLHDCLQISQADTFLFSCSDASLPVDDNNLCVKAVQLLTRRFEVEPKFALHLEKKVPYGAGLGGGSSDAAHTLLLVNEFLGLAASHQELHEVAVQLGSDVPFFLGSSAALGKGKGDELDPLNTIDGDEYALPYTLLLAVPPVHVSTKDAYKYVTPNSIDRADLTHLVLSNDASLWRSSLVNDFEASVFTTYPIVQETKALLYEAGAQYASMSGSGSSVYGLFEEGANSLEVARLLRGKGITVWVE